jgi:hypothetical protein
VTLEFVGRLRDESKFAGIEGLLAQLRRDRSRATEVLEAGIGPIESEPALVAGGGGEGGGIA